jgi:pSer/pThr/pTyr-binding forkhead associated (FHA) protein
MNVANRPQESGSIRFLTGPLAGSTFQISKPLITFGREPGNDIVISDPTVSRQHARLVNNAGQWSIEKLAVQNVVTVNQHTIQQAVIADRDTIGLGTGTTFLFLISSPHSPAGQQHLHNKHLLHQHSADSSDRLNTHLLKQLHLNCLLYHCARPQMSMSLALLRPVKVILEYRR